MCAFCDLTFQSILVQPSKMPVRRKNCCEFRVNSTQAPFSKALAADIDSEVEGQLVAFLDKVEATKSQLFGDLSGPHIFGEFSLADVMVAPILPIAMESDRETVNLSQHPHVKKVSLLTNMSICLR